MEAMTLDILSVTGNSQTFLQAKEAETAKRMKALLWEHQCGDQFESDRVYYRHVKKINKATK